MIREYIADRFNMTPNENIATLEDTIAELNIDIARYKHIVDTYKKDKDVALKMCVEAELKTEKAEKDAQSYCKALAEYSIAHYSLVELIRTCVEKKKYAELKEYLAETERKSVEDEFEDDFEVLFGDEE